MAKSTDMLDTEFKYAYVFKFIRVSSFTSAAITRVKSAHFSRYSCISDDINDIIK